MKFYKGDLLDTGVNFAFGLVFIGILAGAGGVALTSFGTGVTYASGTAAQNQTVAMINNATLGLANMSAQLPTVGTIAGVGLIILVLFTAIGVYIMKRE
jgi:hypothetical protein